MNINDQLFGTEWRTLCSQTGWIITGWKSKTTKTNVRRNKRLWHEGWIWGLPKDKQQRYQIDGCESNSDTNLTAMKRILYEKSRDVTTSKFPNETFHTSGSLPVRCHSVPPGKGLPVKCVIRYHRSLAANFFLSEIQIVFVLYTQQRWKYRSQGGLAYEGSNFFQFLYWFLNLSKI